MQRLAGIVPGVPDGTGLGRLSPDCPLSEEEQLVEGTRGVPDGTGPGCNSSDYPLFEDEQLVEGIQGVPDGTGPGRGSPECPLAVDESNFEMAGTLELRAAFRRVLASTPSWPGADKIYSRLYKVLEMMGHAEWKSQVAQAKKQRRKLKRFSPSGGMQDIIDALNKGDEEELKALNLEHLRSASQKDVTRLASMQSLIDVNLKDDTEITGDTNPVGESTSLLPGDAHDEREGMFEKGEPADPTKNMSEADKKKWDEERLKNKDKFKQATAFPDEASRREYLRKHPDADPQMHSVEHTEEHHVVEKTPKPEIRGKPEPKGKTSSMTRLGGPVTVIPNEEPSSELPGAGDEPTVIMDIAASGQGVKKQVTQWMFVISKDSGGGFLVTLGDPRKTTSDIKLRTTDKADLKDWVHDNVGRKISPNHVIDLTRLRLVPAVWDEDFIASLPDNVARGLTATGETTLEDRWGKTMTAGRWSEPESLPKFYGKEYVLDNPLKVSQLRAGHIYGATEGRGGHTSLLKFHGFTDNDEKYGGGGVKYKTLRDLMLAKGVRNLRALEALADDLEYGHGFYLCGDWGPGQKGCYYYIYNGRWVMGSSADPVSFWSTKPASAGHLAGRDRTPRYVLKVLTITRKFHQTNSIWNSRSYGKPTARNIARFVQKHNESLEPGEPNDHVGPIGAIYGAEIQDQFNDHAVVARWEDKKIIREYRQRGIRADDQIARFEEGKPADPTENMSKEDKTLWDKYHGKVDELDGKTATHVKFGAHHEENGKWYVDTDFINAVQYVYPRSTLQHMGFGEFYLETPDGRLDFDRMHGKDFPGASGRSHLLSDDKHGRVMDKAIRYMERARKSDKVAAGGLYGFTKGVQSDCEGCIRKLTKQAEKVARRVYAKDERVAPFLVTHAKKADSLSAKILVAALRNIGPKLATDESVGPPEEGKTSKRKYGLYGHLAKTARLGLSACTDVRDIAGHLVSDLHSRRSNKHSNVTAFLDRHALDGDCVYSRLLHSSYPDPDRKSASGAPDTVDGWLAWSETATHSQTTSGHTAAARKYLVRPLARGLSLKLFCGDAREVKKAAHYDLAGSFGTLKRKRGGEKLYVYWTQQEQKAERNCYVTIEGLEGEKLKPLAHQVGIEI